MNHPCIIQVRDVKPEKIKIVKTMALKTNAKIESSRYGLDIYFEDVNEARKLISKLRKTMKFRIKMSTKYAGLRGSRVRVLFVYSLRGC
ncbi:NMD3-related protein [Archaeoglobus neptunius]|uniref:NMD3-related protein n=1 Tax=Archaeoglobus neptunius TaxID=2798580 RepID=UPI002ED7841A